MNARVIYNYKLANYLINKGFNIKKINRNKNDKQKFVYLFEIKNKEIDKQIEEDIKNYKNIYKK